MIPEDLYNPPLVIDNYKCGDHTVHVIRDDVLVGGTKQRALVPFMEQSKHTRFVAYGASTGYAMVAAAYAGQLCLKHVDFFIYAMPKASIALKKARNKIFNKSITIHEISKLGSMDQLGAIAKKFAAEQNAFLLDFGMGSKEYTRLLSNNIERAWNRAAALHNPPLDKPKRLWLVAGSATILQAIDKIFPTTQFMVVQVGKTIWPDQLARIGAPPSVLFISDKNFYQPVDKKDIPPYSSLLVYDAKLWPFVKKHGADGDYIWNVA